MKSEFGLWISDKDVTVPLVSQAKLMLLEMVCQTVLVVQPLILSMNAQLVKTIVPQSVLMRLKDLLVLAPAIKLMIVLTKMVPLV